jgi:hypothetical protein
VIRHPHCPRLLGVCVTAAQGLLDVSDASLDDYVASKIVGDFLEVYLDAFSSCLPLTSADAAAPRIVVR